MKSRLKVCHTADWHLGHTLHGHDRTLEHQAFLSFLLDLLVDEEADALIVAGDIFDSVNPPTKALAQYYGFLAELHARLPATDVIIVAGNHDSAARLTAATPVLDAFGVRVIGRLRSTDDPGAAALPIKNQSGEVAAWVAAVPYLRLSDLDGLALGQDTAASVHAGVGRIYESVFERIARQRRAEEALIAIGHGQVRGARLSERSERPVLGGHQNAFGLDVFGETVDYVALGHLHLPQAVLEHEHIRYCGSPLPLSMAEADYPHQVRLAYFEGGRLVGQDAVRVPRTVELVGVPHEPQSLPDVLRALSEFPARDPAADRHRWPLLEVRVRLSEPVADLRRQIERALDDKALRLVRIAVEYTGNRRTLAEGDRRRELRDLDPDEVFRRCYQHKFTGDPPPSLWRAFREVSETAMRHANAPSASRENTREISRPEAPGASAAPAEGDGESTAQVGER